MVASEFLDSGASLIGEVAEVAVSSVSVPSCSESDLKRFSRWTSWDSSESILLAKRGVKLTLQIKTVMTFRRYQQMPLHECVLQPWQLVSGDVGRHCDCASASGS